MGLLKRLHQKITALLDTGREARVDLPPERASSVDFDAVLDRLEESPLGAERYASAKTGLPVQPVDRAVSDSIGLSAPTARPEASDYRLTDFGPLLGAIDPGAFYETSYDPVLINLIRHVLNHQAPISESALVERIARAHGFQRAGRIIRERVVSVAERRFHLANGAAGGTFVWHDEAARLAWNTYRVPASEQSVRPIEDIAPEELKAAAMVCTSDDHPLEIARLFGIRRLSSVARNRILESLDGRSGADPHRRSDA